MRWDGPIEDMTPERARRVRAMRRIAGLALMVAAIGALVVGRCGLGRDAKVSATLDGAAGVARGLAGDPRGFDDAALAYEAAMRDGLFDAYPYFARSLVDRLRGGAVDGLPAALTAMIRALRADGLDAAEKALAAAPDFDGQAAAWRFLGELRQAELRRRAAEAR
ncbi:MAG: hypothetical protein KC635_11630 [Myxococcales bacterium]|nr:hypothetical protein [Myxococcales bacterium]